MFGGFAASQAWGGFGAKGCWGAALGCVLLDEETCREHGIRYRTNKSVTAALESHVRWLKHMGGLRWRVRYE